MVTAVLFWTFLLTAAAIFAVYGQNIERIFIIFILICSLITLFSYKKIGFYSINIYVIATDVIILILAIALYLNTDRYWPGWFAGFHTNSVATHVSAILMPDMLPVLFYSIAGAWALPALGTAAYGVLLDYRSRTPRDGRSTKILI